MLKLEFKGKIEVVFFREDEKIIAFCPSLDLATCGNDIREAKRNFEECLKIYLEETIKHGTLEKDLLKLGWKPHPIDMTITPPEPEYKKISTHILKSIQITLPLPA